jgi:4-amino-4-deoxy-L-arabinose transferase-like glycosyltransferase
VTSGARAQRLLLAATLGLAALVYGVRLGAPSWDSDRAGAGPRYLFDERYTAFTAHRLLQGDPTVFEWAARRYEYAAVDTSDLTPFSRAEWTSPPGAPLAVAPFIAAFGFSAASARLASLLAALVTLVALAWLAGLSRAWIACLVLVCDGAFFVLARTAMPYMLLVAGVTAGAALLVRALRSRQRRLAWTLAAGAAFGFAVSVRLTAVPLMLALLGAVAISREGARERFLPSCLIVLVTSFATYAATFLPHFLHGVSLSDVLLFHRRLSWFHHHVPRDYPQTSRWYTWPAVLHPVLFGSRRSPEGTATVWCMGGRLLWWATVPVFLHAAWRARDRSLANLLPAAGIAAAWLPWAALDRFGMSYYLLPALPFVALSLAALLERPGVRRLASTYLAAVVLLFAVSYPVLASVPLPEATLQRYLWAFGLRFPAERSAAGRTSD